MATLSESYFSATARLGENTRKLAFAGVAFVWLLSNGEAQTSQVSEQLHLRFPGLLLWAMGTFIASLIFDWLQSVVNVWIPHKWGNYQEGLPKKKREHEDVWGSSEPNWPKDWRAPSDLMLWGKAVSVGAGYVILLVHLIPRISP